MSDYSAYWTTGNPYYWGSRPPVDQPATAAKATTAAQAAKAASAGPQQVYVQVGESRTNANIIRDNYAIPSFEIDKSIIDDVVIGPVIRNKVVSQSIQPGTVVAKGTAVELVLAPTSTLPGRIIPNGHTAFADATMEETYGRFVRDDPVMRRILERNPDVSRLSSEDRATAEARASDAEVEIGERAGTTTEDFLRSLHLAKTMVE